ncbi:hypothetical protein COOONC_05208 [Cooperia oncophora]
MSMLPLGTSSFRDHGSDESSVRYKADPPGLTSVRTTYVTNKFSPLSRQLVTYRDRNSSSSRAPLRTTSATRSQTVAEIDMPFPRLVEETSTSRAACSSGIVRLPINATQQGGRYLLRIPKNDIESRPLQNTLPPRRMLIPTVPPSMSMGGECSADEYEILYESGGNPLICVAEDINEDVYYQDSVDKKNFYCSEITCFWHGPTQASLRRHMMITHSRNVMNSSGIRACGAQTIRRSTKPKGVCA